MTSSLLSVGIDVLQRDGFRPLQGQRVGLLTNPSAVDQNLRSTYDIFRTAPQVTLAALFSPEHGFSATAADGETVASSIDPKTGVPIHSLYGATLHPTSEMLEGLDIIVCDIQDIGVRYYTFTWTISHLIEAAGAANIPVMILDRPNPLGWLVDGAPLDRTFSSLVGRYLIPTRHGMTLGELTLMMNQTWNPTPANVSVIACEFIENKAAWFVPPSPNMPHLSTVYHYVGACLIEGTNLSEGRGTSLPFHIVGAPFIDADRLSEALIAQISDSQNGKNRLWIRPHAFRPTASKFSDETCFGVQIHAEGDYPSLDVWLTIIRTIRHLYPDAFAWNQHFDRLMGDDQTRAHIDQAASLDSIRRGWDDFCAAFIEQSQPYRLYARPSNILRAY